IWAGGDATTRQSPKLCRVYRGESECFPLNEFMGSDIWALHEDGKGQLWVCTNIGVWRLRKGSPQKFAPLSRGTIIRAFDEDATGTLIFSDGSKMEMLTPDGQVEPYPIKLDNAHSLLKSREGDLWAGTFDKGIVHVHEGRKDRFTILDGLSHNSVKAFFQDR